MRTRHRINPIWIISLLVLLVAVGFVAMSGGRATDEKRNDNRTVVVIDAGHGGNDPGAIGVNGVLEKDLNLDLAKLVYVKSLAHQELQLVLTRRSDVYLELADRLELAADVGAELYVSIHANAHSSSSASGIETYIGLGADDETCRLAEILHATLIRSTSARDRGVRTSDLYVGSAKMPAVLLELGFLTNPAEAARLASICYQDNLADAILSGILLFLENSRSSD